MNLFESVKNELNESESQYDQLPELIEAMENGDISLSDIIHDLPSDFDYLVDIYDKFNEVDHFMDENDCSLAEETIYQVWDLICKKVEDLAKQIVETSGKDVEEED